LLDRKYRYRPINVFENDLGVDENGNYFTTDDEFKQIATMVIREFAYILHQQTYSNNGYT
jgi:hypothetical protein